MQPAKELANKLKEHWSYDTFRPLQQEIMTAVLAGHDTLAVLPTGAGKSICFQLPALIAKGTCVVISPLIALINDQISTLKKKGLSAVTFPTNSTQDDIIRIFDQIKIKQTPLVYLSPERLALPAIQDQLKRISISFFAVDEAHCISHWGHDFRPSYLQLKSIKQHFPKTPILAVTATATQKTQTQICELLRLEQPKLYTSSITRKNIAYHIYTTPNKLDLLTKILKKTKASTIIYLQSRQAVTQLAMQLKTDGFTSVHYHAGLSANEKKLNFNLWKTEKATIMVATNAFGMGIDKSNVRLIVHLEIPSSLENYVQEAGRAGRDNQKSFSCVLLSHNDFQKFEQQTKHPLTFKVVKEVYLKLNQYFQISYGYWEKEALEFDLDLFCNTYNFQKTLTEKALRKLEYYNILTYTENYQSSTLFKIICSNHQLLQFCKINPSYSMLVEVILRNYTGVFDTLKPLNLPKIVNRTQLSNQTIHQKLLYLKQHNLIELVIKQNNHSITFLKPREDKRTINPIKKEIEALQEIESIKNKLCLSYFKNESSCRTGKLLNYFDESSTENCGTCDVCLQKNDSNSIDQLTKRVLDTLQHKTATFNDLLILLQVNSQTLQKILIFLSNESKIVQQHQHYKLL